MTNDPRDATNRTAQEREQIEQMNREAKTRDDAANADRNREQAAQQEQYMSRLRSDGGV